MDRSRDLKPEKFLSTFLLFFVAFVIFVVQSGSVIRATVDLPLDGLEFKHSFESYFPES